MTTEKQDEYARYDLLFSNVYIHAHTVAGKIECEDSIATFLDHHRRQFGPLDSVTALQHGGGIQGATLVFVRYQDRLQHANACAFFDGKTFCNRILQVRRSELTIEATDARRALRPQAPPNEPRQQQRRPPVHERLGPARAQPRWDRRARSSPYTSDRFRATRRHSERPDGTLPWWG